MIANVGIDLWSCCRCFFLQRPRLELFERIDLRVEQMVDRGLLQVRPSPFHTAKRGCRQGLGVVERERSQVRVHESYDIEGSKDVGSHAQ